MTQAETIYSVQLPDQLAQYIDGQKLIENAAGYPEMQRELSTGETSAIELVKKQLLAVDLSHGTPGNADVIASDGIRPEASMTASCDWRSGAHPLDRSLGLDNYTFMRWGAFQPSGYGRRVLAINTPDILLSPKTIVSPRDINDTLFAYAGTPAPELPPQGLDKLNAYLDSLVTGVDWVEITARRALHRMMTVPNQSVYRIRNPSDLGEVKHHGSIASSSIHPRWIDTKESEAMHAKWREMLEFSGVAVSYVTNALDQQDLGQPKLSGNDKLPHEIGADIEQSRKLWSTIIEIAHS